MRHAKKLLLPLSVAAAALALAACGTGGDTAASGSTAAGGGSTAPQKPPAETDGGQPVPTIDFENGEAVGGIEQIEVSRGEDVRFKVHSDVAEEVHVHGYDLMKDVAAGGTVEFDFPAEIEGIFEAEMEGVAVQILELQVNP
ncbi:MAG: hypothetical protein U0R71_06610 [Solirubrobacterales bacterium]